MRESRKIRNFVGDMNTIMKLFLLPVIALCCVSASAQYPFIFRNDAQFNQIDLTDEIVLQHKISSSDTTLMFGENEIPLRAIDYIDFRQTDIPTLKFTLPEYPDYEWVKDKTTYLNATLDIDGRGTVESAEGLQLTVKGRGNTTWGLKKKPLRLKFEKKTSICGLKKAKSYVLLANYIDPTHLRNAVGLWVARRLGMEFAVDAIPCNVYFNGKYCGLYLLTDKIGTGEASVNIDEETGILFEASKEFDEDYKFRSSMNLPIMVKDPDFAKLYAADSTGLTPDERLALWADDLNNAEKKIAADRGYEAFDMASAVDYFLTMNFCSNSEIGYPKSVYFYKRDLNPDSLYYFGPVWDLDVAFNIFTSSAGLIETSPEKSVWKMWYFYYFEDLEGFQNLYAERLTDFATTIYPELCEWLENYSKAIEPAAKLDGLRWPETSGIGGWTYRTSSFNTAHYTESLITWMNRRLNYILREAGLDITYTSEPLFYDQPEGSSGNKSLNIHNANGSIKSFSLSDGLTVRIANDELSVGSQGDDYSCPLDEVRRIDYAEAPQTTGYSPLSSKGSHIEIYRDYAIVEPNETSIVEIIDVSGRRVYSATTGPEGKSIDLTNLSDGIYILTLNGIAEQKFRIINR